MTEKSYNDFDKLVGDIKSHVRANPNTTIVENDDVLRGQIRYMDETGNVWKISVADLHKWVGTIEKKRGDLIRRAFQSQEGKKALLDVILKAR